MPAYIILHDATARRDLPPLTAQHRGSVRGVRYRRKESRALRRGNPRVIAGQKAVMKAANNP